MAQGDPLRPPPGPPGPPGGHPAPLNDPSLAASGFPQGIPPTQSTQPPHPVPHGSEPPRPGNGAGAAHATPPPPPVPTPLRVTPPPPNVPGAFPPGLTIPAPEPAAKPAVVLPAQEMPMTLPDFAATAAGKGAPVPGTTGKEEETTEIDEVIQGAPPWLISFVIHLGLLILTALLATTATLRSHSDENVEMVYGEKLGDQLIDSRFDIPTDTPISPNETPAFSPSPLPPVEEPIAASPTLDGLPTHGGTLTGKDAAPTVGFALKGRETGMKVALLGAYGGNATTESSVKMGLEWLVKQQRANGSWSLLGPYPNGASGSDNPVAATALALLAFQGAGNTHTRGEFKANVAKAWEWMLKQQDEFGNFYHEGMSQGLYSQAISTIAICELVGMTDDAKYRAAAEKAVAYAVKAQDKQLGGWRYIPGVDSDTSVTGWFVMALQSAKMAYISVPQEVWENIERYLNGAQVSDGSRYAYQPGKEATYSMTAEGLLCRQYMGWKRDDERLQRGVKYLVHNLPNWDDLDVYYWYYATQVTHHMEGDSWKTWNDVTRQLLPEKQEKNGKDRGSWNPRGDRRADAGGRLYVTCLSIYMLEVYYRHLPLYSNLYQTQAAAAQPPKEQASKAEPATEPQQ